MPIIDVSGLMSVTTTGKEEIRDELKGLFTKLGFSVDSTTVTFIEDLTTGLKEHIMARLYSKSFMNMEIATLEKICDDVVSILEKAGHPFNEAFIIPVLAMKGKELKTP